MYDRGKYLGSQLKRISILIGLAMFDQHFKTCVSASAEVLAKSGSSTVAQNKDLPLIYLLDTRWQWF